MYCSEDDWEKFTKPLKRVDPFLREFADKIGATIDYDHQNNPSRAIRWGDQVIRLIQIFLDDEKDFKFTVWICASEDRGQKRYWKNETIFKNVDFEVIENQLKDILDSAYKTVESWKSTDLQFAVELKS